MPSARAGDPVPEGESTGDNVIAKEGADGIACFAIRDPELGIALYAPAANEVARHATALHLLQRLGALPEVVPGELQESLRAARTNTRGEVGGVARPRGMRARQVQRSARREPVLRKAVSLRSPRGSAR